MKAGRTESRVHWNAPAAAFIAATVLVAATAPSISQEMTYQEAPMLAEMVASGDLPPVSERLPAEPVVVDPLDQIGSHGGTLHRALTGATDFWGWKTFVRRGLVEFAPGSADVVPALAQSWEISNDGQVFTFHIREGLRWSDGEPFGADDIQFFYQAIASNEDLTPNFPGWLMTAGKPVVIEKIDDLTVNFTFSAPNAILLETLASWPSLGLITPKHYLEQFHPDYAPADELEARLAEAGFDNWYELFKAMDDVYLNPDRPVMGAWKVTQAFPETRMIAERNPYYWKVDSEGNQLPYLDRVTAELTSDAQVIALRAASGGIDLQYRHINFSDLPVLLEGAQQGPLGIKRWDTEVGWVALHTNQSHKDPVIRELMQDVNFRAGLSHAIDREEVNELLYSGLASIGHPLSRKGDPFYVEGTGQRFIAADVDKANEYLDDAGLVERDEEGYRLRPDGERLEIEIMSWPEPGGITVADAYELVAGYWDAVDVRTRLTVIERALWFQRAMAGDYDIAGTDIATLLWILDPAWYVPTQSQTYFAPLFGVWYQTGGASGEEPPSLMRRLQELYDEAIVTVDPEKRAELGKAITRLHDENVWIIGVGQLPFQAVVVNDDLVNVLEDGVASFRLQHMGQTWPEQVSFRAGSSRLNEE